MINVEEQFNQLKHFIESSIDLHQTNLQIIKFDKIDTTALIVVCEKCNNVFPLVTSIKQSVFPIDYKYCPICGKEIVLIK